MAKTNITSDDKSLSDLFKEMKLAGKWLTGSLVATGLGLAGTFVSAGLSRGGDSNFGYWILGMAVAGLSAVISGGFKSESMKALETKINQLEGVSVRPEPSPLIKAAYDLIAD